MITSDQVRAARALLRITAADLSTMSGVGLATIKRLESVSGLPQANVRTVEALRSALEAAGIEFVGTPSDRPGVRLVKPKL